VPQKYDKFMEGRESQFTKTSHMGINLGYKGYEGTLLEYDIVLDTTEKVTTRQSSEHGRSANRKLHVKEFTGFHFLKKRHRVGNL